jgi:pimeloyl-ACP methyl ester carboxylesterase
MRAKLLIMLLILTGVSSRGLMQEDRLPHYEDADCPIAMTDDVRCGYLTVPENRDDAASRDIRLAVAILAARTETPLPDPVVYLAGGAGDSALANLQNASRLALRDEREVIVMEQRGTRYSEPSLFCYELQVAVRASGMTSEPITDEIARETAAAEQCRDRLVREGIDLSAYHSRARALDLEDLRAALGYSAWNLYGNGYGTRIALEAMRTTPDGIRSVMLEGVYPPNYITPVQRIGDTAAAFERIFAACAAQPACNRAYPTLRDDFSAVLRRYDESPVLLVWHNWGDVVLDGGDLGALLLTALNNGRDITYIPFLIEEVKQGRDWILKPIFDPIVATRVDMLAEGVYYSVECHERAAFATPALLDDARAAQPEFASFYGFRSDMSICAIWGAGQADAAELEPVRSAIPALILAGEYDPVTSVTVAEQVGATLPNSQLVVFPNQARGVSSGRCAPELMKAFLADPTQALDTTCKDDTPPFVFVTSEQVWATPAFYRMFIESPPVFQIFFGLLLLEAGWVVRFVMKRWRGETGIVRLALVVGAVNIAFVGLLALLFARLGINGFGAVFYGIPPIAVPLLVLPVIAVLLCIPLARLLWKSGLRAAYRWHLLLTIVVTLLWLYALWDIGLYRLG